MSKQNELSVGQSLIGLGIVLGGGWALSNLDTVTEVLGEVVSVVFNKFDFVAWNRANDVAAFDEYVINEVQRLGGMSNTNAGRFYDSLNFTDEENTRLFFKFYPSLICGKCGNEYNTLFHSSCPKCRERRRKLLNAGIGGFNTLVGSSIFPLEQRAIKKGRGRNSGRSVIRRREISFSEAIEVVKRDIIETKMPAPLEWPAPQSTKSVDEQVTEVVKEKPKQPTKHKTPKVLLRKFLLEWRTLDAEKIGCTLEELDALNERSRVTKYEWMIIVRKEYPGANWEFVQGVRGEVYALNRPKVQSRLKK
jgi:DNA-binding Lrp family transcriptional regulator